MKKGYDLFYYGESIIYHKVSSSTGKNSPLYYYYYTRNRCILIDRNLNSPIKQIAFLFFLTTRVLKIVLGRTEKSIIIKALKDYRDGVIGYKNI